MYIPGARVVSGLKHEARGPSALTGYNPSTRYINILCHTTNYSNVHNVRNARLVKVQCVGGLKCSAWATVALYSI